MTINYLKVITALFIGHPMTKEVAGSRVTSDTSEMQVESQTSERGTCNEEHGLVMIFKLFRQTDTEIYYKRPRVSNFATSCPA